MKKITPLFLLYQWKKYNRKKEQRRLRKLKDDIVDYLAHIPPQDRTGEQQATLDYFKNHPFSVFPYPFTENYNADDIVVHTDNEKKMHYVLRDNKRLYFRNDWDESSVKVAYHMLLIEQDAASPHRYETDEFHVCEGDIVVDAGVAEGNFALSVIEKVKKLYLFEVDPAWIAALEATFAPWKEKVVIVNKYVSDHDEGDCITLDTFFGNEEIDFIKADIEGAEPLLVAGAQRLLSARRPLKIAICTYHRQHDAETLHQMLQEKGFRTAFSNGYMVFPYGKYLTPPYLRRVLIRATKFYECSFA
ncbi:MAG: FkbM family methyltransferase [Prevotellaceae bacterium]|nr:FkbM family methyltransferase [Prevotellaceae bacterium]